LTATNSADPTTSTSSQSDPLLSALGAGTTEADSAAELDVNSTTL
jgi:hypothetical protein